MRRGFYGAENRFAHRNPVRRGLDAGNGRQSMGSSALMPQPTSQKAPKFSRWVAQQGMMSPGKSVKIFNLQACCAFLRESKRHPPAS